MFVPGTVIDQRYEIIGPLASGGMGEVYRARRTWLGDEVAIKVVRPVVDDAEALRNRFLRESRVCAQLRHPNIVTILDFDIDADGRPFLVMEFLNGPSLKQELAAVGRFGLAATAGLITPLAGAIALAHDRGIVHRDIKPANIVSHRYEQGEIVYKLIDFGLVNAREMSTDATRLTQAREFVGTVTYASPEQLLGEPVDTRSDIYSLGALVFEMVTGRPPFTHGDALSIASQHITQEPVKPTALASDLPGAIDDVILKALAKKRNERWQKVSEFVAALAAVALADAPTIVSAGWRGRPASLPPGLAATYDIGERLGRGRLGSEVYAGRHRALDHPVAIRTLRKGRHANWDAVRARFLQEARGLQVSHPSVIQVRDFGEEADLVFVVTELIASDSLREVLTKDGPIAWPRVGRLADQLLDGAAALGRRGTFISGLHPEIIRLGKDADGGDRLLISSAGICQAQDLLATLSDDTLRGAGPPEPELPYVAPEILMGRPADQRSDVFTLGVLLYEMSTARLPLDAGSMHALLGAMLTAPRRDPRTLAASLPDTFAELVLRAMSGDPAARFESAAAMRAALPPV